MRCADAQLWYLVITYALYFTHRAVISSIKCTLNGLGIFTQLLLIFVCSSAILVSHFLDLYFFPHCMHNSQSRITLKCCIHSKLIGWKRWGKRLALAVLELELARSEWIQPSRLCHVSSVTRHVLKWTAWAQEPFRSNPINSGLIWSNHSSMSLPTSASAMHTSTTLLLRQADLIHQHWCHRSLTWQQAAFQGRAIWGSYCSLQTRLRILSIYPRPYY